MYKFQFLAAGPKLGMFRVEIENPPEDIKTPGVEFVEEERVETAEEKEEKRNTYLENLRRQTITEPVVKGPRAKAASSDWS